MEERWGGCVWGREGWFGPGEEVSMEEASAISYPLTCRLTALHGTLQVCTSCFVGADPSGCIE